MRDWEKNLSSLMQNRLLCDKKVWGGNESVQDDDRKKEPSAGGPGGGQKDRAEPKINEMLSQEAKTSKERKGGSTRNPPSEIGEERGPEKRAGITWPGHGKRNTTRQGFALEKHLGG